MLKRHLDVSHLDFSLVLGDDIDIETLDEDLNLWLQCCDMHNFRAEWTPHGLFLVCTSENPTEEDKLDMDNLLDLFGYNDVPYSGFNSLAFKSDYCYYCGGEDCSDECGNFPNT